MNISRLILALICLLPSLQCIGQNCNYFLYYHDTLSYKACLAEEKRHKYYQYSKEYQSICDEAIRINPDYPHAYSHKSTAYLKSGDFVEYERLMARAVELDPKTYIGDRAWCRYGFFRNYAGAIEDFETMIALKGAITGYSAEGDYHLSIAYALCQKAIGNTSKAIEIIEKHLAETGEPGLYDAMHLAVLYLEKDDIEQAQYYIEMQVAHNNFADAQYYYATILKQKGEQELSKVHIAEAKDLYDKGKYLRHDYGHHQDKVFYRQIVDFELSLNEN